MKHKLYTPLNIKDVNPNACHSMVCTAKTRQRCEKDQTCHKWLSGSDEADIVGMSSTKYNDLNPLDKKEWELKKKLLVKVALWRKKTYRKCKAVIYDIRREK